MENRIDLARYFKELGFKVGAEIGVADGRYSEILLSENPDLQLLSIDPYAPYDGNWRGKNYQNQAYEKAKMRLSVFGDRSVILRNTSLEASVNMIDNSLDFVFIDGAHDFNNVMLDIIIWTTKVKKGGIVSGHDAYDFRTGNVLEAIHAYSVANKVEMNIIPRSEQGHKDDRVPCWYFIKK